MITVTNNQIHRDDEHIGDIIGSIAWMKAKPAGRIAGQIRQVAGIDGLKFEVVETSPIPAAESVIVPAAVVPVPVSDDAGAGNAFHVPADWGTPGTAYFSRCFINHHGNDAYSTYCKANGI